MLGRIARARGDATLIAASRRWFAIARRTARRDGFRVKGWPSTQASVMFGPIGIAAAQAIVHSSPQTRTAYLAAARARARAPAEYMFGWAGNVLAAIAVARATGSPAVTTLVRELASARGGRAAAGGFAHGDVGILAARLAAARWCGLPLPRDAIQTLRARSPSNALAVEKLKRSWCNGLAGHVFAWALAGDERCRANAIASGPLLLEALDEDGGSLCCGLGGRAYALLAIARLDPGGPWFEHAIRLATRALAHPATNSGMTQGLAGLIGLAHDLRDPSTARFPFVDVLA